MKDGASPIIAQVSSARVRLHTVGRPWFDLGDLHSNPTHIANDLPLLLIDFDHESLTMTTYVLKNHFDSGGKR